MRKAVARNRYLEFVEGQWYTALKGDENASISCGKFELFILFAVEFNYHPRDCYHLDPDLVDEFLCYFRARNTLRREEDKKREIESERAKRNSRGKSSRGAGQGQFKPIRR